MEHRQQTRRDAVDTPALRNEFLDSLLSLIDRGLLSQTSGNVSVRVADDQVLITPSSTPYDEIGPDDLVLLDLAGRVVKSTKRPSAEVPLHLAVYADRPDFGAIVHTHSPLATTFAVLNRPIPAVHYMITMLDQTSVPVAPYALFGTEELASNVRNTFLAPSRAVLLANHGVVVGGESLKEAAGGAETVELLAGLLHRASAIGEPKVLTNDQLQAVVDQRDALAYGGRRP